MADILLFVIFILFLAGILLFFLLKKREKKIGSLKGKILYQDSDSAPVLRAKTLPLCGKPDYILKTSDTIIPIEFKSGRTPSSPYLNHTMQLMSYCYIATEVYGTRPKGGIIKYPDREFQVEYTKEAEESVRNLVNEMIQAKEEGKEFMCSHPDHNLKF